jgi:hypothetical protein
MLRALVLVTIFLCLILPARAQEPEWYHRSIELNVGGPKSNSRGANFTKLHLAAGKPAGCPSRWCGCWLGKHLGIADRSLWLARNWARVGRPANGPAPGVIVVWRGHVGKITAVEGPGKIRVLSGNDGRAVRERVRSTAGVIAFRYVS